MAQLLVREIPEDNRSRAEEACKGERPQREAKHRAILQEALKPKREDLWAEMDRLRQELADSGCKFSDTTALLRQDRDSR